MYDQKQEVLREIQDLAAQNEGVHDIEKWIDFAKNPNTASYHVFDWNNKTAGHQWRLQQGRQYLKAYVTLIPNTTYHAHAFVSLTADRYSGGGFRPILVVLSDAELRAQLVSDALADLETFKAKYEMLSELSGVFSAIKKVKTPKK